MQKIVIVGGEPLQGTISISGSKNAALPLMAASILTDESIALKNTPNLADIHTMGSVLDSLGVNFDKADLVSKNEIKLTYADSSKALAEYDLVRKMRASILVLGPLLARKREATVSLPGGCAIGARPINIHVDALTQLGGEFNLEKGYIKCEAKSGLRGAKINLPMISVGATENIIMAATLAKGETEINNIATEPEIMDLIDCLKSMGAIIEVQDNRRVLIQGVDKLHGTTHTVIPDRIEAGTYIIAGAITKGELEVTNLNLEHIDNMISVFKNIGVNILKENNTVRVKESSLINNIDLDTKEFPGFPTDMQAQIMVLLSLAGKPSTVRENIFENRFMHVPELNRMGANIDTDGSKATINPCNGFSGAQVMATDLRASVSLVLASLIATGETTINRVYHLDRGYERLEDKLASCGANIQRIQ
ncbi:MAG: UDP-N-acetylglucosamine 1-carboxyvinyltransferase [Candidatus Pelagibacterales bacterium]|jgi:UDP-N-acetylglucosamine 1-carboxyvinyltransferase|tara:strand:- start:2631 stop:3896 length:1266 start_codon:yes stop_codon:yes gene_type:complete